MNFDIVSFIPRAVMQGIPLLYGSTGEILTEKSGNLNLGIPGIMYVGGICGVIGAFFYEQAVPADQIGQRVGEIKRHRGQMLKRPAGLCQPHASEFRLDDPAHDFGK